MLGSPSCKLNDLLHNILTDDRLCNTGDGNHTLL